MNRKKEIAAIFKMQAQHFAVGKTYIPQSCICQLYHTKIAPIELATGKKAYFIGKPNPLIMRDSLKRIQCRREDAVIIGDRMDTDIIAGIESEIETVLVLSGITRREDVEKFPYRPGLILDHVGQIAENS